MTEPPGPSKIPKKKKKEVEVVVFHSYKKKSGDKGDGDPGPHQDKGKAGSSGLRKNIFDQRKAKYDIRKLGIYGMDKKDKESAMVDLLVDLGARPPKNRCYHIQEYQKMKKLEKQKEKEAEEMERKAGIKKKKLREKRQRDKDDLLNHVDGQAGFFKDGVQFVKKLKR